MTRRFVERFHIIDTLVSRNKREVYVIYGAIFTITVEGFSRIETGDWIRGSKVDLAKKSEIRPPVNVKFLDRKTPEIYLEILARDRKGDQKLLPEVWVLNGRDWGRRVLRARDLDR